MKHDEKGVIIEGSPLEEKIEVMRGNRRTVAKRMTESYFQSPVVTQITEIDMTDAIEKRKEWNIKNSESGMNVNYLDMLIAAAAHSLRNHPSFNVSIEENKIHYKANVNVGFAMDLEGKGLIVPVIQNSDVMCLNEIALQRQNLIDKIRNGIVSIDEVTGGTFTITNLGSYGIDAFTPIINPPEAAILGVGRIIKKPVVVNDEILIRSRMVLSLTYDHRLNDGGPAARFLAEIANRLENPCWMFEI